MRPAPAPAQAAEGPTRVGGHEDRALLAHLNVRRSATEAQPGLDLEAELRASVIEFDYREVRV